MNSGIYRLTFSSGKFYIGKSIDITKRWQQHWDKFSKGKAALRMQAEYDLCGFPQREVVFSCHEDHIDIMETWIIDQMHQVSGNDMLNATYAEPIQDPDRLKLKRDISLLELSTPDHVDIICTQREELVQQQLEVDVAVQKVQEYRESGILVPQEVLDQREYLSELEAENFELTQECTALAQSTLDLYAEFHRYKSRPWYRRLFS